MIVNPNNEHFATPPYLGDRHSSVVECIIALFHNHHRCMRYEILSENLQKNRLSTLMSTCYILSLELRSFSVFQLFAMLTCQHEMTIFS